MYIYCKMKGSKEEWTFIKKKKKKTIIFSLFYSHQLIIQIWQYLNSQMWWQKIPVLQIFYNEMPLYLCKVIYCLFMYCLLIKFKFYLKMCLVLYSMESKHIIYLNTYNHIFIFVLVKNWILINTEYQNEIILNKLLYN